LDGLIAGHLLGRQTEIENRRMERWIGRWIDEWMDT
jgi:hypothetical protein